MRSLVAGQWGILYLLVSLCLPSLHEGGRQPAPQCAPGYEELTHHDWLSQEGLEKSTWYLVYSSKWRSALIGLILKAL